MSRFGEYLKYLLEKNEETISSIAKKSEVERTSIHRAINGERNLSYIALKKIQSQLCLTSQEIRVLNEYHDMQLQGEEVYEIRNKIAEFVNSFSNMESRMERVEFAQVYDREKLVSLNASEKLVFCEGEPEVLAYLRRIIYEEMTNENPVIYMNTPVRDSFLYKNLRTIYAQYKTNLVVKHLIPYVIREGARDAMNALTGVQVLKETISLLLLSGGNYQPWISYRKDLDEAPMPYFVITSNKLLMVADHEDRTCCLIADQRMVDFYRKKMEMEIAGAQKYIRLPNIDKPFENATHNEQLVNSSYTSIGSEGLLARYVLGKNSKTKTVTRDGEVNEWFRNLVMGLNEKDTQYQFFLQRVTVERFVKSETFHFNGMNVDVSLSMPEKIKVLRRIITDIEKDVIEAQFVYENELHLPENIALVVLNKASLYLCVGDENESMAINIDDTIMKKAIFDFFEYLPKSDKIYSKEETISYLESLVS